jgi:hypothetical protein
MTLLKKEGFSPQRRKDHKGLLWVFSVLGVLSVLAVPFFSGLTDGRGYGFIPLDALLIGRNKLCSIAELTEERD